MCKSLKYLLLGFIALGYSAISLADSISYYDYAEVVNVRPIKETIRTSAPHEECYDERVTTRESKSYTGTALGAVVGGVVGNQFGHKEGKVATTVAGAALGAAIGSDMSQPRRETEVRRRCETVDDGDIERRVVGYQVTYRYRGQTGLVRLPYDPGDRLRVRVQISPVIR